MSDTSVLPASGPWSLPDRDAFPDDGRRREIIDGNRLVSPLLVSPRPGVRRQGATHQPAELLNQRL